MDRQTGCFGLIHPSLIINANHRLDRHERDSRVAALRTIGLSMGRVQLRPIKSRVRVVVVYCFPNRIKRDAANYHPTTKALIDGLTKAGVWPDDDDRWVEGPDNRIGPTRPDKLGRVAVYLVLERPGPRWVPPAGMDRLV